MNRLFWVFIKGMMMGIADLVPGVSGGTIAFITEIYEELIDSISKLRPAALKILYKDDVKTFWSAINGSFLSAVFGGILFSVFSFSYLISWLYQNQQVGLFAFFFGILISSFFFLKNSISRWKISHLLTLVLGAVGAFVLTQLAPTTNQVSDTYLFFCGFIAISAMLLPGLSGSYLLLVLGVYPLVLESLRGFVSLVSNFDQKLLLLYGSRLALLALGIIAGLLLFSRFLKWLLSRYKNHTMAALLGLMLGASHKIWPWQIATVFELGTTSKTQTHAVWPQNFDGNPQLIIAIICFILGVGMLVVLEKIRQNKSTHEHH